MKILINIHKKNYKWVVQSAPKYIIYCKVYKTILVLESFFISQKKEIEDSIYMRKKHRN